MPLLIVVGVWLMFAAVICAAGWWLAGVLRLPRRSRIVFALVTLGGSLAGVLLWRNTATPAHAEITLTAPAPLTHVTGTALRIEGSVQPAGARIALAVRAEGDPRWWIQTGRVSRTRRGGIEHWAVEATLGTRREGAGQAFEVVALASANGALFDVFAGRYLLPGSTPAVPPWAQSAPVLVWRAQ